MGSGWHARCVAFCNDVGACCQFDCLGGAGAGPTNFAREEKPPPKKNQGESSKKKKKKITKILILTFSGFRRAFEVGQDVRRSLHVDVIAPKSTPSREGEKSQKGTSEKSNFEEGVAKERGGERIIDHLFLANAAPAESLLSRSEDRSSEFLLSGFEHHGHEVFDVHVKPKGNLHE